MIPALRFAKIAAVIIVAVAGSFGAHNGAAASAAGPNRVVARVPSAGRAPGTAAPINPLRPVRAGLPNLGSPHSQKSAIRNQKPETRERGGALS